MKYLLFSSVPDKLFVEPELSVRKQTNRNIKWKLWYNEGYNEE